MAQDEIEKDFSALEHMRRARMSFEARICDASVTKTAEVIEILRLDSMFDFAEFLFTIDAMGLKAPGDISILADVHDQRIIALLKDKAAMRRRRLREETLLGSIFTSDVRPRLEAIWDEDPGSLDQSNLARFLVTQMSAETTRTLAVAAHTAGFVSRSRHTLKVTVVKSTGVIERIFASCMRDMRIAISNLRGDHNAT